MKAVQDETAARVHNVPKISLHNRIKGKVIYGVKPGPKQYLNAEEETELAKFEASSVGCRQTQKQIITSAARYYDKYRHRRYVSQTIRYK